MRINRFKAQKVHGHLDFDVSFFDDLTFLTGINGSGKTTVVRSISALMQPWILYLADTTYSNMEVHLMQDDNPITIKSEKGEKAIILETSETSGQAVVPLYPFGYNTPWCTVKDRSEESDYYREVEGNLASDPVLKLIVSLPSPMFLGIERRITEFDPRESDVRMRFRLPPRLRPASLFRTSLDIGLTEAAVLAKEAYQNIQRKQLDLTNQLRNNILLSALEYQDPFSTGGPSDLALPIWDIGAKRELIGDTFLELGLNAQQVDEALKPLFGKLNTLTDRFSSREEMQAALVSDDEDMQGAIAGVVIDYSQAKRLSEIASLGEAYLRDASQISEPIDRYLEIVNGFFGDSGKKLQFDETGNLEVSVPGSGNTPLYSLSSGEIQIVVMITNLVFHSGAQQESVFMVDEPELSLHLRWQEIFVESVMSANPSIQVILATHSPSIILDRTGHCFDLSGALT